MPASVKGRAGNNEELGDHVPGERQRLLFQPWEVLLHGTWQSFPDLTRSQNSASMWNLPASKSWNYSSVMCEQHAVEGQSRLPVPPKSRLLTSAGDFSLGNTTSRAAGRHWNVHPRFIDAESGV